MHLRRLLTPLVLAGSLLLPLGAAQPAHAGVKPATVPTSWDFAESGAGNSLWGNEPFAGAGAGDLFGDGRQEIVTAFPDGKVYVFGTPSGGTAPVLPGWPKQTGKAIQAAPAIADLFNDGKQEVIAASQDGYVYVWDGYGNLLPGWPQCGCYGSFLKNFIGGAVVGDLFGNGQKEIVAEGSHYVFAWDRNGRLLPGFPVNLWDSSAQTPALVDLDRNGRLWIIAGGDSHPGHLEGVWYAIPPTGCPYPDASLSGCDHGGWPKFVDDQPWSSPAGVNAFEYDGGYERVYMGTGHGYNQNPQTASYCASVGCGKRINAFNPDGSNVGGWPVPTAGTNFGSVAVGDLGFGSGQQQIAEQSDVPTCGSCSRFYVRNADGSAVSNFPALGTAGYSTNIGSPAIGPVSNVSGNGVWTVAFGNIYGWDNNAGLQNTFALPNQGPGTYGQAFATPNIVDLGDGNGLQAIVTSTVYGSNVWHISGYPIPNAGTGGSISRSWPTFHGNTARNGGQVPVAHITAPANNFNSPTPDFNVTWAYSTLSVPANRFNVWVKDGAAAWQIYRTTTAMSTHFYGVAGHSYKFFVDAQNALGSAQLAKAGANVVTVNDVGASPPIIARPFKGLYVADLHGTVHPLSSPPVSSTPWAGDLARGIATRSDGQGGYVVDAYGVPHPFGNAPAVSTGYAPWYGKDLARGIALATDSSGYVLDAYGFPHPFGGAPNPLLSYGLWSGVDLARGISVSGTRGYVTDAYGGLHYFGVGAYAPPYIHLSDYWSGKDLARGVITNSVGTAGYIVDTYGGQHPFSIDSTPLFYSDAKSDYWYPYNIGRGAAVIPSTQAGPVSNLKWYIIDVYGGAHPSGATLPVPPYVDINWYRYGENVARGGSAG